MISPKMYNFKSTLLILLLGVILIVPTVYCFSLFGPSLESDSDLVQNDSPQTTIIDVIPPVNMDDSTKDSSIDDDITMEDSTADDDDTSKDSSKVDDETPENSSKDDDDTSEDTTIDDDDVIIDPSRNDSQPSSNGGDPIPLPVIVIVEDNSGLVNAKSEHDSRRVDSSNNWLIINKKTSIRKVEEETEDFGKKRKVLSEDRDEELRIYRDNIHTVIKNGIDLTNVLRL